MVHNNATLAQWELSLPRAVAGLPGRAGRAVAGTDAGRRAVTYVLYNYRDRIEAVRQLGVLQETDTVSIVIVVYGR